jgi:capsid assembly protease
MREIFAAEGAPYESFVQPGYDALLVHPAYAERAVRAGLSQARNAARFNDQGGERIYRLEGETALIPIMGTLIPRGQFLNFYGLTSYEGIRFALRTASTDPKVERIVLLVDSPGGYVAGVDAAAAAIRAARGRKPVTSVVEGMAASAAYWLAAQADEIVASPVSELGSIGVVQTHIDISRLYDDLGVKVTLLHAGAKKVDGNPFEPLPDRVRGEMKARLEDLRLKFAEAVVAGRPALLPDDILRTEAATYLAEEAISRGLADRVGLLEDVLTMPAGVRRLAPLIRPAQGLGRPSSLSSPLAAGAPQMSDYERGAAYALALLGKTPTEDRQSGAIGVAAAQNRGSESFSTDYERGAAAALALLGKSAADDRHSRTGGASMRVEPRLLVSSSRSADHDYFQSDYERGAAAARKLLGRDPVERRDAKDLDARKSAPANGAAAGSAQFESEYDRGARAAKRLLGIG